MTPAILLTALLSIFPTTPARDCLTARRERIAAQVDESVRAFPTVRPALLMAVAFSETHLGCDRNEGGGWGAPINPQQRHRAGTHLHAARALARSLVVCRGSELGALRRFRTGLCDPMRQSSSPTVGRVGEAYGRRTLRLAQRMETTR